MTLPDLTQAILARTSGAPCGRLRERACAFVDGELPSAQAALVAAHLEHCLACTALVARLREARAVLPGFATVDPGPWFAARVLRACAQRPQPSRWQRLIHRPRIALESAYLGAALGFVGMCLPLPGHPEGLGAPPVSQALAPLKPGVGAMAKGLHAVAEFFKRNPAPPTEPPKPPSRSSR